MIVAKYARATLLFVAAGCPIGCGDGDSKESAGPGTNQQAASACSGLPKLAPGAGFAFDEGTLHLNPGQDGLFCRQGAVPAEYADGTAFITGLDAEVSLGTHHLIVTASDAPLANTPPLCRDTGSGQASPGSNFQDFKIDSNALSVIETLRRIAFGGGGGNARVQFPKGYGKPMPLGFFESSHHVVNLTSKPVDICGRFNVYAARAEEIQHPLGVIFGNALDVNIAPNSAGSVEGTLTVTEATDIVVMMSHAHNFLTRFEMMPYQGGNTAPSAVYTSENWETPAVKVFDPPLHLAAGEGITFRCSYRNTTAAQVKWGVTGGEMCMPFALYALPDQPAHVVPPTQSAFTKDAAPKPLELGAVAFGG
jgi:hypothetical protein